MSADDEVKKMVSGFTEAQLRESPYRQSDDQRKRDYEAAEGFNDYKSDVARGAFGDGFICGLRHCRETEVKELQEKLDLLKNCAQQYGESVEIIEEQLRVAVEGLKENSDFHHCGLGCKPGCKWHSCIALQKIEAMKGGGNGA